MFTLKKIDLGSVALYSFVMILVVSLIFVIPFGFFFMVLSDFLPESGFQSGEFDSIFPAFGMGFIIGIPIFYAVLGTIMNVLIALIYNLLSNKLGGIKFSLESIEETSVSAEESQSM